MITATIYVERVDIEDIEVTIEADYSPATADRLWPWPGEPGESETIDIISATAKDGTEITLTKDEITKAEDAIRSEAESMEPDYDEA